MRLPLQLLLDQLAQSGLPLDPATHLRVQQLLHQAGSDLLQRNDWEGLRLLLGPVIARDEAERATFDAVFEERFLPAIQRVEDEAPEAVAEAADSFATVGEQVHKRRIALYLSAAVLAMLLLVVGGSWFRPAAPASHQPAVARQDTETTDEFDQPVAPAEADETAKQSLPITYDPTKLYYHMDPRHVFAFTPKAQQNLFDVRHELQPILPNLHLSVADQTRWRIGSSGDLSLEASYRPKVAGLYEMEVNFPSYGEGRNRLSRLVYLPQKALSTQDLYQLDFEQQQARRSAIKWTIFLLALVLIVGLESYLTYFRQRRYRLAFRVDFAQAEQGHYRLTDPQQERRMRPEPAFYDLAQRLNQRRASDHLTLDLPQTLRQTIRRGGLPTLAYQTRSYPSEYLVLVEQAHAQDQQARLFLHLMELLRQEDVLITVCTFTDSPATCRRQSDGEPFSLDQLYRRYARARLIVFSDGMQWATAEVLADLDDWAEKALLTPRPVATWDEQEEALAEHFLVLPTDLSAQLNLVEAFTRGEADTAAFLERQLLAEADSEPLASYDLADVHDLRAYLGDRMLQWLAATAVHPQPEWELTLRLGQALDERARQRRFAESGQFVAEAHPVDLLTFGHLQQLARLPWLQAGVMPPQLRRELLDQLDPELEHLARQTVADYLAEPQPGESEAQRERRAAQHLVQQAHLQPDNTDLQRKLRLLWQEDLLDAGTRADLAQQYRVQGLWRRIAPWLPGGRAMAVGCVLVFLGWVGGNLYQHQPAQLMAKYGAPFQEPLFHDMQLDGESASALAAYAAGDYTQALDLLAAQAEQGWHPAIFHFYQANALLVTDQSEAARTALDQIAPQSPGFDALVQWYRTLTFVAEKDYANARTALAQVDRRISAELAHQAQGLSAALHSPWVGR